MKHCANSGLTSSVRLAGWTKLPVEAFVYLLCVIGGADSARDSAHRTR
jgi:hypothetical protein